MCVCVWGGGGGGRAGCLSVCVPVPACECLYLLRSLVSFMYYCLLQGFFFQMFVYKIHQCVHRFKRIISILQYILCSVAILS